MVNEKIFILYKLIYILDSIYNIAKRTFHNILQLLTLFGSQFPILSLGNWEIFCAIANQRYVTNGPSWFLFRTDAV